MDAVIFGGGKIARGFVAHLLNRSHFHITFVELNTALVESLNEQGRYYVNIMGHPDSSQWIDNFTCLRLDDISGIGRALSTADIAFTSVGGKNLDSLGKTIADAYARMDAASKNRTFSIITCENWKEPAAQLKAAITAALPDSESKELFLAHIGISEGVILRSGVEATEDVLKIDKNAVSVTDYWEIPMDKTRILGEPILFEGSKYLDNFTGFLQQKIYTFNTTNATIAYLGSLRGITDLATAANDPEIVELVHQVHNEINPAIAAEMHIPLEEQTQFSQKALRKYQDRAVTDFTERHARDPMRKIGPFDRIVGTIRLIEKHGGCYDALATTLAAALYYPHTNPNDPTSDQLRKMRQENGIDAVLEQISKVSPEEKLSAVVKRRIDFLKEKGWLNV